MSGQKTRPVIVVGAGPVGLLCALELARRGVDVRSGREVRIMRARRVAELGGRERLLAAPQWRFTPADSR